MSLSQSYPDKFPSLLYPPSNTGLLQQAILPSVGSNILSGNTAAYAARTVGGRRGKKRTIIRLKKYRKKTCKNRRRSNRRK